MLSFFSGRYMQLLIEQFSAHYLPGMTAKRSSHADTSGTMMDGSHIRAIDSLQSLASVEP